MASATRWEYRVVALNGAKAPMPGNKPLVEILLDEVGAEGWELVSVLALELEGPTNQDSAAFYFKRPVH
jgi:Domain of unknown function (DUF4177)